MATQEELLRLEESMHALQAGITELSRTLVQYSNKNDLDVAIERLRRLANQLMKQLEEIEQMLDALEALVKAIQILADEAHP